MKSLSIATFNLFKDERNIYERIKKLKVLLEQKALDIICLQEVYANQNFCAASAVNERMQHHKFITHLREKKRNGLMSSSNLAMLTSTQPIEQQAYMFKEGNRAFQIERFKKDGCRFTIVNTHLCHVSSVNRLSQLKQILKVLEYYRKDTIFVCGDLNAKPVSRELALLEQEGYFYVNSAFTHEKNEMLDYILIKTQQEVEVSSCISLKELSDHYCLENKVIFKE